MILVDPRFGSERPGQRSSHRVVAEALAGMGLDTEPVHLDFGDFSFLGNGPEGPIRIGVELKVVSDLVNSMRSGRLAEQVIGMAETYARSYLVVEGLYRASRRNGLLEVPRGRGYKPLFCGPRPVFWSEVERFITSLEEVGVRVKHTRSSAQTAALIGNVLYKFWDKDYDEHKSLKVMRTPAIPMALVKEDEATQRVRRVAHALGVGIGWGRSKAVAERFGSVEGLTQADASEWATVEGIGKNIARDAFEAIRERIKSSTPRLSTRRVPPGNRVADRSARHSRKRQDKQLDSGRAAARRVPAARRGRRVPR